MKNQRQLRVRPARLLSVVGGLLAVLIGSPALAQAAPLSKVAPASATAASQPVPPSSQNRAIQVSATVSRTPPAIQLS
jgi:hypothetical protein